jgi:hypothetical protein
LGDDAELFADDLSHGNEIFIKAFSAVPLPANEVTPEDRVRWHELTGAELGEDVYMVSSTFTHEVILPRQTLRQIYQTILTLRAEFPEPPFPWLFCVDPYYPSPAEGKANGTLPSEEELMCQLEARAVAFKEQQASAEGRSIQTFDFAFNEQRTKLLHDLEKAGLFNEVYSKEKLYWLEQWELPTLLDYHRAALAFLSYFQQKPVANLASSNRSWQSYSGSTNSTEQRFALKASIGRAIEA